MSATEKAVHRSIPLRSRAEKRGDMTRQLSGLMKRIPVDILAMISAYAENTITFEECELSSSDHDGLVTSKTPESKIQFRNTYDDWITVPIDAVFDEGRHEWEVLIEEHRHGEINGIVCGFYPEASMDIDAEFQCIGWSGPGWGVGNWGQRVVRNTQSGSYRRVARGDRFGFILEFDKDGGDGKVAFFVNGVYQGILFENVGSDPLRAGVCLFYPESKVRLLMGEDLSEGMRGYVFNSNTTGEP